MKVRRIKAKWSAVWLRDGQNPVLRFQTATGGEYEVELNDMTPARAAWFIGQLATWAADQIVKDRAAQREIASSVAKSSRRVAVALQESTNA